MRYRADFNSKILDLDGNAVRLGAVPQVVAAVQEIAETLGDEQRVALAEKLNAVWGAEQTLASVCIAALLEPNEQEKNIGAEEKIRRFELARRLSKRGLQEFNDKERDLLKKVADLYYRGALIAPTIAEMLEGAERLGELKDVSKAGQAGRASIGALAAVLAIALSGCAAATAYVQQHAAGLAATALVAGTATQVGGALINADELARRAERRIEGDDKQEKR